MFRLQHPRLGLNLSLNRAAQAVNLAAVLCFTLPACNGLVGDGTGDADGSNERRTANADDIDGDGIDNALDADIDGDGVPNIAETGGADDLDGDGIPNADDDSVYGDGSETIGPHGDADGDGLSNSLDSDDDGDGIPDGVLGVGSCDGTTTASSENNDCDGYCLYDEAGLIPCDDGAAPGSGQPDSDGDGLPDIVDDDDDGDGISDGEDDAPDGTDPGDETPPGSCVNLEFSTGDNRQNPRVLLVVDKSGSMNWRFGSNVADEDACVPGDGACVSKWETTQQVLGAVVTGLESSVDFGLMVYPSGDSCDAGNLRVGVQPGTADDVIDAMQDIAQGNGGTPTAATLAEARDALATLPSEGGTRAVVLATDGGPNCNASLDGDTCRCVGRDPSDCSSNAQNCLDDVNAISSAAQLNAAGFPVFVIGISGAENYADVLNALAASGGTGTAYSAQSGSALADALEDIAVRVGGCRFDLPESVSPNDISVTVNGGPVERDTRRQNGWDLVDPNTVELFGVPCQEAARGGAGAGTVFIRACSG